MFQKMRKREISEDYNTKRGSNASKTILFFRIDFSFKFHELSKLFPKLSFLRFWPHEGAEKSPYSFCSMVFDSPSDFEGSPESSKINKFAFKNMRFHVNTLAPFLTDF